MRVERIEPISHASAVKPLDNQGVGVRKDDYPEVVPGSPQPLGEQKKDLSEEEVIMAIEKANKDFEIYDTRLEFSIHEKTKEIMIKVIRNDEVIREIPPEKILDMVAQMMEMAGLLVDEKV